MKNECPFGEKRNFPFARFSVSDVPPEYVHLRENEPVCMVNLPTGDVGYVVTRYEDVRFVLSDSRFSRAETIAPSAPRLTAMDFPAGSLFTLDPPDHTRLRKLVSSEFTPRRVELLIPRIQSITDTLLDAMAAESGPVDLNTFLCFPLPAIVISALLGVPLSDREHFRSWADASVALTNDPADAAKRQQEMIGYLARLIEAKRVAPGDDLLSALIGAHDEKGALTAMELLVMAMSLLVAGFETTGSVLGTGILTLLRDPAARAALDGDDSDVEQLIEEILRVNPIGDGGPVRIALEDVTIAGQVVPKGSLVIASVSAANFDKSQFEGADDFDPGRNGQRHLAFGHGIHYCLGAPLARAELTIAFKSLFQRFPSLTLAVPDVDLRMKTGALFHRLERLPVRW